MLFLSAAPKIFRSAPLACMLSAMRFRLALLILAAVLLFVPGPGPAGLAQIPEKPTNLEVLPDSMTTEEVIAVMRGFTAALGVRCQFCHVGREGMPLDSFDFASDEVHEKEMARGMMRMVERINEELLPEVLDHHDATVRIQCVTCHRGAARPVMLEDSLGAVVERFGADSLAPVYERLRERHYGRFAYDFGERPLVVLAARLSAAGRHAEARSALELGERSFPESAGIAFELGRVYEALGEQALAVERYEKALRLQPEHQGAQRRLQELAGS
jgi:hypothetical protein